MPVNISQLSVVNLMDGRYLFVPDYQRGYRWTEQQVKDLLHDLISFINEKGSGDFYSLQPIIVKKVSPNEYERVFGVNVPSDAEMKGVWEIIDGQQRLTTLLILFRFLMQNINKTDDKLKQEGKSLYSIHYETRKGSAVFLNKIGPNVDVMSQEVQDNVDFYCMGRAYHTIHEYIYGNGQDIGQGLALFSKSHRDVDKLNWALYFLLNGEVGNEDGSVQVMWYALPEDWNTKLVHEFQKINSGKIPLTDAELIKGLLIRKRNFEKHSADTQQEQYALQWEQIENRLCNEAFWGFLHKRKEGNMEPANRIDLLFRLIYRFENNNDVDETALADPRKSIVFRYFSNKFEVQEEKEVKELITDIWKKTRDLFWLLEDWFNDPIIYNLVGLLTYFGVDVVEHVLKLKEIEKSAEEQEKFIIYLKRYVSKYISNISKDEDLLYGDNKVKGTLLAINIAWLNRLCDSNKTGDTSMYKFPFASFAEMKWDIEHIASLHDKKLEGNDAKIWVSVARDDLKGILTEDEEKLLDNEKDDNKNIDWLRERMKEKEYTEDEKNDIGNLTLLDLNTNRSYGNALFCTKRRIIMQRIKNGQFVLPLTQYVFFKLFDEKGTNRSYWTREDMAKYKEEVHSLVKSFSPKIH